MTHVLKTWPEYFDPVSKGLKTFEIRKNDRDYKVGDVLILKEYNADADEYSGRIEIRRITYLTDFHLDAGYVCLGISLRWDVRNFEELKAVKEAVDG
jgi:hypothetical protein